MNLIFNPADELEKSCCLCQHYTRTQTGPHYWNVDCGLKQRHFDALDAQDCPMYAEAPLSPETALGFPYGDDA